MSLRLGIDAVNAFNWSAGVPNQSPRPLQGERATPRSGAGRGGSLKRHIETRSRAKELRARLTEPEQRLWHHLRANRFGVKFQRQVVLPPYIADFASRNERLVIELDGDTHGETQAYDAARTRSLEARDYRVIRFTNADVMTNIDGVLQAIRLALSSPHPLRGERVDSCGGRAGRGGRNSER